MVSPSIINYSAFGTQFEKIIYFCCVGVDSLFNKFLSDNGISTRNAKTDTFVKLKNFLRVDEYELTVVHYPWLPPLRPFLGWSAKQPSKSLAWFDAYNSLKHDKQANQHAATMGNALNAACAHCCLAYAVFGGQLFTGYLSEHLFFHFEKHPSWNVNEIYFDPDKGVPWQPKNISI